MTVEELAKGLARQTTQSLAQSMKDAEAIMANFDTSGGGPAQLHCILSRAACRNIVPTHVSLLLSSFADGQLDISEFISVQQMQISKLPKNLRNGYGAMRKLLAQGPGFTSLPDALMWPNPEVTLGAMFSTGLLSCASAVLGAWVSGFNTRDASLTIALVTILAVLGACTHQAHQLLVFLRVHNQHCWQPSEPPQSRAELDDPLFALLTSLSCGCIRPMPREQGSFECPEEDQEEPARTERARECSKVPTHASSLALPCLALPCNLSTVSG